MGSRGECAGATTANARTTGGEDRELAGADATIAYRAVRTLTAAPRQALPLMRQRLTAAEKAPADSVKISRLLEELDSTEFEVREKASRDLHELGDSAESVMRRALREQPSLEVRRRLEQILDKLESGGRPPDQLRMLRGVEVLERIGIPEARQVLESLARGASEARLTQEAKAALARLAARPGVQP